MVLPIRASADLLSRPRLRRLSNLTRLLWRTGRFLARDPLALFGIIVLTLAASGAIFAHQVAPHDPNFIDVAHRLQAPTRQHWLGTDELGRDLLSRVIYGGRVSLVVSSISIGAAAVIGTLLGGIAGLLRGWAETLIMRLSDILLSFPAILFAIVLIAFLGVSLTNVIIAIAVAYTPSFIRVAQSSTLVATNHGYVEAARAVGTRESRILIRHVLPNIFPVILVQGTLGLAGAILVESSLSFLGLGVQPPLASWGSMISAGQLYFNQSVWATLFPGLAIMLVVLGFNFLGDGLTDSLDPRLRLRGAPT
jgi:peptide/nickel transport system permease protein